LSGTKVKIVKQYFRLMETHWALVLSGSQIIARLFVKSLTRKILCFAAYLENKINLLPLE